MAQKAGYDGVEVMGSEGYLINEFIAARTNQRTDEWGGATKTACASRWRSCAVCASAWGPNFIIIYRLSMLDLVDGGSTFDEVVQLAQAVEAAGATIINTGIGWHEARIPTIATSVPRGAFAWVTQKMKGKVKIPLITTNRINTPEVGEKILADGCSRHGLDGAPAAGRPDFREQGGCRQGRRDQHLHWLQPGLPGPHLQRQDHVVPGQPACLPRDRVEDRAPPREEAHRGGGRGPSRLGGGHRPRLDAATT
jgi:2,4-dienoyl-CoA reductase (NADPH2)